MFSVPPSVDGNGQEGANESYPITLEGYKSSDFERLATLISPKQVSY